MAKKNEDVRRHLFNPRIGKLNFLFTFLERNDEDSKTMIRGREKYKSILPELGVLFPTAFNNQHDIVKKFRQRVQTCISGVKDCNFSNANSDRTGALIWSRSANPSLTWYRSDFGGKCLHM